MQSRLRPSARASLLKRVRAQAALSALLWGALFALAYGQSPLFTSNQHQYFLHGLAKSGYGLLGQDWLAGTLDPTPAFTALVEFTQRWIHPIAFYAYYGVLLALYVFSLHRILAERFDLTSSRLRTFGSLLTLTVLHSAALRFVLARALGDAFLLEGGFAGQRLLGPVLQPSSFGALLMVSLALFLSGRPHGAGAAAALAAAVHPTYMLPAASLVGGYLWLLAMREGQTGRALTTGMTALILVLPALLYSVTVFRPTSPTTWRQASEVLVDFRLPHHADPRAWFGPASLFRAGVIALGLQLTWRTRLAPLMLALIGAGGLLSGLRILTGSHRLALLFPWRVSTVLVPICSGLLLFWLLRTPARRVEKWSRAHRGWLLCTMWACGALLAAVGIARTGLLEVDQRQGPDQRVYSYVRQQRAAGQVYLIPPKLQEFRLETGAPAFVDFKSIPYQDVEVLAWYERVQQARFFYRDDPALINCDVLDSILELERVTHVVLGAEQFGLECPQLSVTYKDDHYAVFVLDS